MCRQLTELYGRAQIFSEIFLNGGRELFAPQMLCVGFDTEADVGAPRGIERKEQKLYGVLDKLQMK